MKLEKSQGITKECSCPRHCWPATASTVYFCVLQQSVRAVPSIVYALDITSHTITQTTSMLLPSRRMVQTQPRIWVNAPHYLLQQTTDYSWFGSRSQIMKLCSALCLTVLTYYVRTQAEKNNFHARIFIKISTGEKHFRSTQRWPPYMDCLLVFFS